MPLRAQVLRDAADPDVGYGIVEGAVGSYAPSARMWINVDDKDYKIDNVQRIDPGDIDQRIDLAQNLNGYFVSFSGDTEGEAGSGTVTDVQWDKSSVFVTVGGRFVPYENILRLASLTSCSRALPTPSGPPPRGVVVLTPLRAVAPDGVSLASPFYARTVLGASARGSAPAALGPPPLRGQ